MKANELNTGTYEEMMSTKHNVGIGGNENNIYELKCTENLTITNKLQLVVYAFMWKKLYPDDNKRFYLFNIKRSNATFKP